MIIYRLNQSEMKKYIELGTLDVKIGPFSRILGLETQRLPTTIHRNHGFSPLNIISGDLMYPTFSNSLQMIKNA